MARAPVVGAYVKRSLYENRTALHRQMGPPESCDRCHGRGYHPSPDEDDPRDVYCDCACGDERRRVEA